MNVNFASMRTAASTPTVSRNTYDAGGSESPEGGLGKLVRKDDAAATGDKAVDAAHDSAGIVLDFYKDVLGRNSIDDKGMRIDSVAHFGTDYNNAYWDGSKMTYGDGDGKQFGPLSQGLDVVGHEISHGVTQFTSGLAYEGQTGALNESWSDVMGEVIEQWHEQKGSFGTADAAKGADWLIGEDVMTPGVAGDALRSMKAPGTAYPGDDQPASMDKYVETAEDNGGVHINSGIPNKAAYDLALKIGSEKLAKIWYTAGTTFLQPDAQFTDAAAATIAAAKQLFKDGPEVAAVTDAWKGVGIVATGEAKPIVEHDTTKFHHPRPVNTESMFPKNYQGTFAQA